MPLFISFEGIEGTGKTTQISLLAQRLRQRSGQVLVTREPGGCPIADTIRAILLDPTSAGLVPRAELLLYAAARAQHVEEVIRPALLTGRTVLCDRFIDATLAYQGYGRGLDLRMIGDLNRLAAGPVTPDLTLLLDLPEALGLQRARRRNTQLALESEERFERESLEFHQRVRLGYLELARQESRFRVIDAVGSVAEVAARIGAAVDDFLQSREGR
ncbi:MAG: dTMP kinase [Desulfuromonadales bacterium]|nr:dTMP kinase [Desulfuromonadales bacterium]